MSAHCNEKQAKLAADFKTMLSQLAARLQRKRATAVRGRTSSVSGTVLAPRAAVVPLAVAMTRTPRTGPLTSHTCVNVCLQQPMTRC